MSILDLSKQHMYIYIRIYIYIYFTMMLVTKPKYGDDFRSY